MHFSEEMNFNKVHKHLFKLGEWPVLIGFLCSDILFADFNISVCMYMNETLTASI